MMKKAVEAERNYKRSTRTPKNEEEKKTHTKKNYQQFGWANQKQQVCK